MPLIRLSLSNDRICSYSEDWESKGGILSEGFTAGFTEEDSVPGVLSLPAKTAVFSDFIPPLGFVTVVFRINDGFKKYGVRKLSIIIHLPFQTINGYFLSC